MGPAGGAQARSCPSPLPSHKLLQPPLQIDLLIKLLVSILVPLVVGKLLRDFVPPVLAFSKKYKVPLYLFNNFQVCVCGMGSCRGLVGRVQLGAAVHSSVCLGC